MECGQDFLKIHGTNSDEPLVITGPVNAINITSSTNQMQIEFHSNDDNTINEGFSAAIHYQGTISKSYI